VMVNKQMSMSMSINPWRIYCCLSSGLVAVHVSILYRIYNVQNISRNRL
jgi:hypothetical protein